MKNIVIGLITVVSELADIMAERRNKWLRFMENVLSGKTGDVLDKGYKIINEKVKEAEEIGANIKRYIEDGRTTEEMQKEISDKYGLVISEKDISGYIEDTSEWKYKTAFGRIREAFLRAGFEFAKGAINLGIELAVSRFYGKR